LVPIGFGHSIDDDIYSSIGEHFVRVGYCIYGGHTCHHMGQSSAHNETFFFPNNGDIHLWHQSLGQHCGGAPDPSHSDDYKPLSTLHDPSLL
jgi:hypothetical protein